VQRQIARDADMTTLKRRKYPRYSDHAPIVYAGYSSQSYSQALMHNSCFDGMYFETGNSLEPDCDLFIKVQQDLTRSSEPDSRKYFRAKVKWCHQITIDGKTGYGIGVQFIARSHLSYGVNIKNSDYICNLCEEKVSDRLIHQTESWLILCQDCLHYMESLPGILEKNLERNLLGNVI
jgi:hypothetical protein